MVSVPLFTISNIAMLHVNFSFISKVLWVPPSSIIANPDISSINGVFTLLTSVPWVSQLYGPLEKWARIYSKN